MSLGVVADTHGKVWALTVCVSCSLHVNRLVDRRICFTIRQKRIRGGVLSLKVTARHLNNAGCSRARGVHWVERRGAGREGQGRSEGGWRVGRREQGRREEAMMLGRERASVEEGRVEGGRVDEGNERWRVGTRHWPSEGNSGGMKRREEGLSEEGREQGSKGGRKTSRDVPWGGHWPVCSIQRTNN